MTTPVQDELTHALGRRIRQLRVLRGLTAKDLGVMIGLKAEAAAQQIYRYEDGVQAPHLRQLRGMAKALGVSTSHLLADEVNHKDKLLRHLGHFLEDNELERLVYQLGLPKLEEFNLRPALSAAQADETETLKSLAG